MIYMLCRKHICLVCNSSPCNNKCCLMGPQNCRHLGTAHWGWTRKGCYNLWHVGQLEDGTIKSLFVFSWSAWWSSSPRIAVPIWASWDGEESIDKAMGQLCGCQLTAAHFNIHRARIAWWKQKQEKICWPCGCLHCWLQAIWRCQTGSCVGSRRCSLPHTLCMTKWTRVSLLKS